MAKEFQKEIEEIETNEFTTAEKSSVPENDSLLIKLENVSGTVYILSGHKKTFHSIFTFIHPTFES